MPFSFYSMNILLNNNNKVLALKELKGRWGCKQVASRQVTNATRYIHTHRYRTARELKQLSLVGLRSLGGWGETHTSLALKGGPFTTSAEE